MSALGHLCGVFLHKGLMVTIFRESFRSLYFVSCLQDRPFPLKCLLVYLRTHHALEFFKLHHSSLILFMICLHRLIHENIVQVAFFWLVLLCLNQSIYRKLSLNKSIYRTTKYLLVFHQQFQLLGVQLQFVLATI